MVREIEFPINTHINGYESESFYRDAFTVKVTQNHLEAKHVYHCIFGYLPKPVRTALAIRNSIVKLFGFSASNTEMSLPLDAIQVEKKAGFLNYEIVEPNEVVCGAYDKHMDMWLAVIKNSDHEFVIATLVNLKTKTGSIYMTLIKPFHKLIAKYCIRKAVKSGRL